MTKKELKQMVAHAYEMKAKTHETEVAFQIYSNSIYILDTEEDNVIEVCETEQEAIDCIAGIDGEGGYKSGCYYKPILIDADSGERVTRENFQYYDLESDWVKNHMKDMEILDETFSIRKRGNIAVS
jgi:hypothetical protein